MGYLNLGTVHTKTWYEKSSSLSWSGNVLGDALRNYNTSGKFSISYSKVGLATMVAIVESTVYAFFTLGVLVFNRKWNDTSSRYYAYLRSSTFSIGWGMAAGVCATLYRSKVPDCEPLARCEASKALPRLLGWCYQRQDHDYVEVIKSIAEMVENQKNTTTQLLATLLRSFLGIDTKNSEILHACRVQEPSVFPWLIIKVTHALMNGRGERLGAIELGQTTCDAIVEKRLDPTFQSLLRQVDSDIPLSNILNNIFQLSPQEFAELKIEDLPVPIQSILQTYKSIASLEKSGDSCFSECLTRAMATIDQERASHEQRAAEYEAARRSVAEMRQEVSDITTRASAFLEQSRNQLRQGQRTRCSVASRMGHLERTTEFLSVEVGDHCALVTTMDGEELFIPHTKIRNPFNTGEDALVTFHRFAQHHSQFNYVLTPTGYLEIWPRMRTGRGVH